MHRGNEKPHPKASFCSLPAGNWGYTSNSLQPVASIFRTSFKREVCHFTQYQTSCISYMLNYIL